MTPACRRLPTLHRSHVLQPSCLMVAECMRQQLTSSSIKHCMQRLENEDWKLCNACNPEFEVRHAGFGDICCIRRRSRCSPVAYTRHPLDKTSHGADVDCPHRFASSIALACHLCDVSQASWLHSPSASQSVTVSSSEQQQWFDSGI